VRLRMPLSKIVTANPDSATCRVGRVSHFTLTAVSFTLPELVLPLV